MAAIKSQLDALSGNVKTINPQSAIARFIFGELKGGEHKHDYTMSVISAAIEQAYKGNTRDIPEAVALCTGKSAKARAYHAGFHAIAEMVAPVKYVGKLADAGNAGVREQIANDARSASCEFELAYLASIQNGKVEAAFNRAAKAKTAPAMADAMAAPVTDAAPVMMTDSVVVDIATSVDAVVQAIQGGMLSVEERLALRVALAMVEERSEQSDATLSFNAAMLSAEPVRAMLNA